jgi:hypothetical protein
VIPGQGRSGYDEGDTKGNSVGDAAWDAVHDLRHQVDRKPGARSTEFAACVHLHNTSGLRCHFLSQTGDQTPQTGVNHNCSELSERVWDCGLTTPVLSWDDADLNSICWDLVLKV